MIANLPARKPVPGDATAAASYGNAQHYAHQQAPLYPPAAAPPHDRSHSRTRTNSSTAMPYTVAPPPPAAAHTYTVTHQAPPMMQQPVPAQYIASSSGGGNSNGRRTMSTATTSTSSTGHGGVAAGHRASTLSGYSTASSDNIQRSASSRSGGSGASSLSPSSYVALMRKQKATVWCDRAQHEDPRILAAQRQAKLRATAEVAGGQYKSSGYAAGPGGASAHAAGVRASTGSSSMVGGVRSKIRHHGAPKASAYMGSAHLGSAGVPMRLSASEVDENDSDSESHMAAQQQQQQQTQHQHHSRTGSGRSSLGSAGAGSGRKVSQYSVYQQQQQLQQHPQQPAYANNVTPPGAESPIIGHNHSHYLGASGPRGGRADDDEDGLEDQTPVPGGHGREADDYFSRGLHGKGSTGGGSGSSGEREENFGSVGGLARPRGALAPEQQVARQQASADELRRRGSVDDRTMTMSGVRLFVANPDLSD